MTGYDVFVDAGYWIFVRFAHDPASSIQPTHLPASGISLPSYQEFTDASLRNVPIVDFFNLPILSLSMTAGAPELRSSGENSRGRQSNKTAV